MVSTVRTEEEVSTYGGNTVRESLENRFKNICRWDKIIVIEMPKVGSFYGGVGTSRA